MSKHEMINCDEQAIERFAAMFKALSNPNRLKIFLELLPHLASGGVCTSEIEQAEACQLDMANRMNLAPSTVSHHIKELKHAGLIEITRTGRNVHLSINKEALHHLHLFLQG